MLYGLFLFNVLGFVFQKCSSFKLHFMASMPYLVGIVKCCNFKYKIWQIDALCARYNGKYIDEKNLNGYMQ